MTSTLYATESEACLQLLKDAFEKLEFNIHLITRKNRFWDQMVAKCGVLFDRKKKPIPRLPLAKTASTLRFLLRF